MSLTQKSKTSSSFSTPLHIYSSDPATVSVNSFNTSLPAGQVLVNFTANTTNGNNVHFTISTFTPGRNYNIKKGSSNFMNITAYGSGTIAFNNSVWPSAAFTVQESEEQGYGSASGIAARMNMTPIPSANVSLYYSDKAPYGQNAGSDDDCPGVMRSTEYKYC